MTAPVASRWRGRQALYTPWVVGPLLGLVAALLFCWRVTTPDVPVFDETYYLPAARALLRLSGPVNIEHPLVGKELIALGIMIFGDGPLGWRVFSTVAGAAVVAGVFAITVMLSGRMRPAIVAAILTMVDFTTFIQARIAMLDGFMAAFLVGGTAVLLWAMRAPRARVRGRWRAGSVMLGLAIGAKWAAFPFLVFAGAGFLAIRLRDALRAGHPPAALFDIAHSAFWPGLRALPGLADLLGIAILVYLATFLPTFFYGSDPLTPFTLLSFQGRMLAEQTQVLTPHPYQSSWWSWPLDIRAVWYLYAAVDGAQRGILMIGNPVVLWGGIAAAGVCVGAWFKTGSWRYLLAVGLWAGAFLPFAVIPKSLGFFFYYYPASVMLSVVIAMATAHLRAQGRVPNADVALLVVATLVFLFFLPILSAAALPDPAAYLRWMWLPGWV